MAGTYWIAIGLCEEARPTSSIFFVGVWFLSIYNLLLVPAAAAPLFGWPLRRNRKTATDREVRGVEIRRRSSIRLYGVRLNRKISSQSHSPHSAAIFESPAIFIKRRGRAATAISFMFRVHISTVRYSERGSEPRILLNKKPTEERQKNVSCGRKSRKRS